MKTSELLGHSLDWAVAICEGHTPFFASGYVQCKRWIPGKAFSPSADWGQGGEIIERERINVYATPLGWDACRDEDMLNFLKTFSGDSPLVAAMRCFVASKLGEVVDIPNDLNQ